MTEVVPCVRARATQDLLTAMNGFRPGLEDDVRSRVAPEVLQAVDTATATHWLAMDTSRHVVEAAIHLLGEAEAPKLWRYFFANHYVRSPLLRYFIDGVLRVVGASPAALIRRATKAWPSTYRDFATIHAEMDPDNNRAAIVLTEIHPEVFGYSGYFIALQGAFEGFLEVTGTDGTCRRIVDAPSAMARFELQW